MISLPLFTILVAAVGILWWLSQRKKDDGKYKTIPGPMGLPILGSVLQLGKGMHTAFSGWAKKYGNIFQIKLGTRIAVVVSDPKWLKELFSMEFMTGRQFFEGFELYPNEPLGITSIEGEMWEVHRRFLLRNLRDLGYGKSSMEDKIIEEVKETLERLKELEGKPVTDVKNILLIAVINSLWMIAGSQRFKQDDPTLIQMQADTNKLIQDATKQAVTFFIPWTRYIMPPIKMDEQKKRAEAFYGGIIKFHEDTLQEDAPRDFIDVYLNEMKAQKDNPQSHFYGDKARRQLLVLLGDIMFAGTDTTSMTLQWSVLYLSMFRHVQEKVQEEISAVTGDSRLVSLSDRPNMPYVLAVIDEVLRYSSIASTGVQRRATMGKEFKGYFIPENAWVFGNFHYMHHSPELWGDPENFRPERFLSADGKTYQKSENLIPFSVGRRQCIGEPLARDNIFLFFTNIFQRFSTSFDSNGPEPTIEPKVTLFLGPPDYSVILKDRLVQ